MKSHNEPPPWYGMPVSEEWMHRTILGPVEERPTSIFDRPGYRLPVILLESGRGSSLVAEMGSDMVRLIDDGLKSVEVREVPESEGAAVVFRLGERWYQARTAIYLDKQPGETDADVLERHHLDEENLLPS